MSIRPIAPNLATSHGAGRLTALALVGGLGLVAAIRPLWPASDPAPAPPGWAPPPCEAIAPATVPPEQPLIDAADLVGIYRAGACTLTVNASGTYRDSCGDARRHPYLIEGDELVLVAGKTQARFLTVSAGRLTDERGTTYVITGGVR